MSEFSALLNRLRSRLDAAGLPFVIGGSFALATRGLPRYTEDIDIMVLAPRLEPVHRALAGDPFEVVSEAIFRDIATGLAIDVFIVKDEDQRWAFRTATPERIQGAEEVRVLTAEGLAVMLLREATTGDPRKRPLRLRDVEWMATSDTVDLAAVAPWAKKMGYEKAYADLAIPRKPAL